MPIQGYHLDLSTGACGAVLRSCCSKLPTLPYGTVAAAGRQVAAGTNMAKSSSMADKLALVLLYVFW